MIPISRKKSKIAFLIASSALYIFYLVGYDVGVFARQLIAGGFDTAYLRYFINTVIVTFVTLAPALSLLVYGFAKNRGKWIEYILPVGFGLKVVTVFSLAFLSGNMLIDGSLFSGVYYVLLLVQGISVVAMFIGTLNKGAFAPLLKWSALAHVAAAVLLEVAYLAYLLPRVGFGHFLLNSSTHSLSVILANLFYFALFLAVAPAKKANFK